MKRILIVLVAAAAACGGHSSGPPVVATVALPGGSELAPYAAATPGLPGPEGMALLDGTAYVALTNVDATFTPRGPAFLAAVVPASGAVTLIDLGGPDGTACKEAGFVRAAGSLLYATCAGDFNDGSGAALVEVDPASHSVTRSVATPTSPVGSAAGPTRLWFGDAFAGNVYAVDQATFTLAAGPIAIDCPTTGNFVTTNDVLVSGGDLYALCSNNTGGILTRLDATTGATKMQADVGPTSVEIADMGGGRLAIVSGADSGLRIVTVTDTGLSVQAFFPFSGKTATLQDVRASGGFLYTAASGSNTVQKIDPGANGGPKVIAEANTGIGANPWNVLPLDDNDALVSNLQGENLAKVTWAP
jgi:hypothetical protein